MDFELCDSGVIDFMMDEPTKRLADVLLGIAQLVVITGGAFWAFWRFRRERVHAPRIGFDLDCRFYGPQRGEFIAEFILSVKNKGLIIHRFHDIFLRVRGIEENMDLNFWENKGSRLFFPIEILKDNLVYKQKFNYIFVEPGIDQNITYNTKIPSKIKFIVVRAEFKYDESRTHSIERVFALPVLS
jgi:hypothetical protein